MCFNKSGFYMALLSICGICSYPILVSTGISAEKMSLACGKASINQHDSEHVKGIVQECLKTYPLKDPNDGSSIEESQQILDDNQSNCALKCINENLNVTTEEGLIDVSKIQSIFLHGRNATSPYVLKLISLMSDCERKAGEEVHVEGGLEPNSCKYHILFMHCYSDAYRSSSQEINKLCLESGESEKSN